MFVVQLPDEDGSDEEEEDDAELIDNEALKDAFMLHHGREDVLAKVKGKGYKLIVCLAILILQVVKHFTATCWTCWINMP